MEKRKMMQNKRKSFDFRVGRANRLPAAYSSLYAKMLIDDLHLGVMPIRSFSSNLDFKVELTPYSEEFEKMIISALPLWQRGSDNLLDTLCTFIDEAVHTMVLNGKVVYEKVMSESDDSSSHKLFQLFQISNDNIHTFLGHSWQFIPRSVINELQEYSKIFPEDVPSQRFIYLPKDCIHIIQFPKILGGPWRHLKTLDELIKLSDYSITKFGLGLDGKKPIPGFDFNIYRRRVDTRVARSTNHLGWSCRTLLSERWTEYYLVYRYLTFAKSKAILREHVLNEINKILETVEDWIGVKLEIKIHGLPPSQDFDSYIEKLSNGKLQFKEVFDFCSLL